MGLLGIVDIDYFVFEYYPEKSIGIPKHEY